MQQHERPLRIERTDGTLEGVIAEPGAGPRGGAVICHPHPQYGGSMDNAVIVAVARALVRDGFVTVRFNFGGVGESDGSYSGGAEEVIDARAAIAALSHRVPAKTPLTLVGYSFGAWVALLTARHEPTLARVVAIAPPLDFAGSEGLTLGPQPVAVVAAEHDQFCAAEHLDRLVRDHPDQVTLQATIAGADHFFAGFELEVAEACRAAHGS
jgi:alpha/beta superfamily hydrolase